MAQDLGIDKHSINSNLYHIFLLKWFVFLNREQMQCYYISITKITRHF